MENVLVLDYSKWRCGAHGDNQVGEGITALLNREGYMCCLGQFSLQLNKELVEEDILEYSEPGEIKHEVGLLSTPKEGYDDRYDKFPMEATNLAKDAIDINDDEYTSPEVKIELLQERFATAGYTIQVINKP